MLPLWVLLKQNVKLLTIICLYVIHCPCDQLFVCFVERDAVWPNTDCSTRLLTSYACLCVYRLPPTTWSVVPLYEKRLRFGLLWGEFPWWYLCCGLLGLTHHLFQDLHSQYCCLLSSVCSSGPRTLCSQFLKWVWILHSSSVLDLAPAFLCIHDPFYPISKMMTVNKKRKLDSQGSPV